MAPTQHLQQTFTESKLQPIYLFHKFERAMKDPNEFKELLQQIMSRECNPILSEEEIDASKEKEEESEV